MRKQRVRRLAAPDHLPETYMDVCARLGTSAGPLVALGLLLSSSLFVFSAGHGVALLISMAVGLVCRSFLEWLVHRYVWHARAGSLVGAIFSPVIVLHQQHHRDPDDLDGLVFGAGAPCVLFVGPVFLAILVPSVPLWWGLCAGAVLMAVLLVYEWFHVLAHSDVQPRYAWLANLVGNHRRHHRGEPDACYGVSSALADRVLGTAGKGRS